MRYQTLSIVLVFQVVAHGQTGVPIVDFKSEKPIGEWVFDSVSKSDRDLIAGYYEELDTKYAILDRYALKCEGELCVIMGLNYERFGFLHAEDRVADKERHVFFRKFVKDDDERLLRSPGGGAFGNAAESGFPVHPQFGDRLRIKDSTHIQGLPGGKTDNKLLGINFNDRYFSPLACCLLPYGNFFNARNSRGEPDVGNRGPLLGICRYGKYVAIKSSKTLQGVNSGIGFQCFTAFNNGLPVSYEGWLISFETHRQLQGRTDTKWKDVDGEMLPMSIEATSLNDPNSLSWVSAVMEWKLGRKVPEALFAVEDLEKRRDLNW
jgi:hypothetical protein